MSPTSERYLQAVSEEEAKQWLKALEVSTHVTCTCRPTSPHPQALGRPTSPTPRLLGGAPHPTPRSLGGPTHPTPRSLGGPTHPTPRSLGGPTHPTPRPLGGPTHPTPRSLGGPTHPTPRPFDRDPDTIEHCLCPFHGQVGIHEALGRSSNQNPKVLDAHKRILKVPGNSVCADCTSTS